ncbi:T9SS type A sorting domain-containing protein [Hymenobacter sp. DH14]|uniref:T9SS type A sorting domain-containing protein n=1 Tax=Hymenobacter cyanobacteriorum TaxID=2926463 RepID=A0A9X1VFU7_9BACT|nr:T9SS type A sorting domain-containing protein [Hymenobacter cyanobacteriorum]MCI1187813.1 T9SS type A sorting domain-containing protein [Hymenobacter cyanobacteriorum]
MKFFTRFVVASAALVLSAASVFAATITVQVGDNFYTGPDGTNTIRMTRADVLVFQYVGASSHPTMSDSAPAAWPIFQMNAANTSKTFAANTFTAGTYPFHCTAHGGPGVGQFGTLIVSGTATATLDANLAAAVLNVYPNPSHGQVTVQLNQKAGADYKLRLSNIIGQEIRTVALRPELTAAGLPLDLSDLHNGVYFYSLLVDGKVASTKRLVLQN